MDTASLIRLMYAQFGDEAREIAALASRHCAEFVARAFFSYALESTSGEDCALLYLLIRYFKRHRVFEIGTNIGTSAVCMNEAVRRNGGILTTSDPIDYAGISPWSGIRFIRAPASVALQALKSEGQTADFCFIDWLPDSMTLALMAEVLTSDAIIATHDYHAANIKGMQVVEALEQAGLCDGRKWFLPSAEPEVMDDGTRINACTAFALPASMPH